MADTVTAAGSRQRTPRVVRLVGAAVLAAVVAGLVDAALAAIGVSVFSVPAGFSQFNPGAYLSLTVLGVIGASIAWAIIAARAKNPASLLYRLAIIVVPLTLLADVVLLVTGQPPVGVVMLMLMHAGVGAITYLSLTRIAPASSGNESAHKPRRIY